MVAAGYLVELAFGAAGLIPATRHAVVMREGISWNSASWAQHGLPRPRRGPLIRFLATGGMPMLRRTGGAPDTPDAPGEARPHVSGSPSARTHQAHRARPSTATDDAGIRCDFVCHEGPRVCDPAVTPRRPRSVRCRMLELLSPLTAA